jgi:hypothetical protein
VSRDRGRTIGDFLSEVFRFCTEHWLFALVALGFFGLGPCASPDDTAETKIKGMAVMENIEKHNDRLEAVERGW